MVDYRIMQYIRSIKQNPENIKKIDKETLIQNPQICFELIKAFPDGIKYIPMDVREEIPQICIDAVKANPENIKYVPEQVQIENYQMCIDAVKKAEGLLYYISIDLLEEHPEICLEALLRDRECIEDIPEGIIESNPQIQAMIDIMEDWKKIDDLPIEMLRNNPQLCIGASISSKRKYKPSEELLLNNSELVEKYIKEWNELLKYSQDEEFIIATKDIEYIRNCIKNKVNYFRPLRTYTYTIYKLIKGIGGDEQETIMELFEQKDEYNLTYDEIVSVVVRTKDADFIKNIIDKREEYKIPSDDIAFLIRWTEDRDFIKQCIEQSETYGLEPKDAKGLLEYTKDIPFIINYVQESSKTDFQKKRIKLPKGMTIGMEIESEGNASVAILHSSEVLEGWETKADKSLEDGVEVVSPVLKSEDNREQEIYDICSILLLSGNYVSNNCGGHIHIGADYLKGIDAWKNLVEIWSNTENILYLISNRKGEKPRGKIGEYARPISNNIADAIEKGEVDLETEDDIEKFCQELQKIQGKGSFDSRYSGINFENFGDVVKNTIEFRLANGTLDPDTWIENINLFGGIIAISQELAEIQKKIENGIEITDEEQEKLDALETIRESNDEEQKLSYLLYLAVDEEEQQIYFDRYYANSREMLGFKIVEDAGHIKINKKKIGKIAFTGEDRVTGVDYQQGSAIIQSELDREKEDTINHDISE